MLRVIAGDLKGRKLETPDWPGLRPTSDRLRETIFNVVAPRIAGARMLDGFAGTGAVGIEALSRGAAHVTFVERDPRAARLVETNLGRCRVEDRYAIIRASFADAARRLSTRPSTRSSNDAGGDDPGAFDLMFLDPPYGAAELHDALAHASTLAGAGTLVIIEHAKRDRAPSEAGRLRLVRELTAGDSALAFYERTAAAGHDPALEGSTND